MTNIAALSDAPETPSALTPPPCLPWVAAGFPSPAADGRDRGLYERLVQPPAATCDVRPADPRDPVITVTPDQELLSWGVVTGSLRRFRR